MQLVGVGPNVGAGGEARNALQRRHQLQMLVHALHQLQQAGIRARQRVAIGVGEHHAQVFLAQPEIGVLKWRMPRRMSARTQEET